MGERAGEREREGAFLCSFLTRCKSRGGAATLMCGGGAGAPEADAGAPVTPPSTLFPTPVISEAIASASASSGPSSLSSSPPSIAASLLTVWGGGASSTAASSPARSSAPSAPSGLTIIFAGSFYVQRKLLSLSVRPHLRSPPPPPPPRSFLSKKAWMGVYFFFNFFLFFFFSNPEKRRE